MLTADNLTDTTDRLSEAVRKYFEGGRSEDTYPAVLVDKMRELGLFGMNVPSSFNGSQLPLPDSLRATRDVAAAWQSLAALLGTHLRACLYVSQLGTEQQKADLLPKMASGEMIFAHAYHEPHEKERQSFSTTLDVSSGRLNGEKYWSTNALHADMIIVICSHSSDSDKLAAVMIPRTREGVSVGSEQDRVGMKGVSLCRVSLNSVEVAESDIIGGADADVQGFMARFRRGSALAFTARAAGTARTVLRFVESELTSDERESSETIGFRFAQLATLVGSIDAFFITAAEHGDQLTHPDEAAMMAKIYCTERLQDVVQLGTMLIGGKAYSRDEYNEFARHVRDAAALPLIDTPNDIMLSRIGSGLLRGIPGAHLRSVD